MKKQGLIILSLLLFVSINYPSLAYGLDLTYTTTDGETVDYSTHSGTPLLLDAFATWCEPCKTTILHMKEIHENIGDQVVILSISIDPQSDSLQDIKKWKNDFKATWTFGLDQDKKLFNQYNITSLPELLLFNGEGNLVKQWQGITQPSVIYSELNRQFGIPIPDVQDNGNKILVDQLLGNTGFQITLGLSVLAISLIIISSIVNRGTASDHKDMKSDSVKPKF